MVIEIIMNLCFVWIQVEVSKTKIKAKLADKCHEKMLITKCKKIMRQWP